MLVVQNRRQNSGFSDFKIRRFPTKILAVQNHRQKKVKVFFIQYLIYI
jgi:hypothetical protein